MASPNSYSLREAHEGKTTIERYIRDSDPYRATTADSTAFSFGYGEPSWA